MALSHILGEAGTPPEKLETSATVTFEEIEGGWKTGSSQITVKGTVPGTRRGGLQGGRRRRPRTAAPSAARSRATSSSAWRRRWPEAGGVAQGGAGRAGSAGPARVYPEAVGAGHARHQGRARGAAAQAPGRGAPSLIATVWLAAAPAARAQPRRTGPLALRPPAVDRPLRPVRLRPAYTRNVPAFDAAGRAYIRSRTSSGGPRPPTSTRATPAPGCGSTSSPRSAPRTPTSSSTVGAGGLRNDGIVFDRQDRAYNPVTLQLARREHAQRPARLLGPLPHLEGLQAARRDVHHRALGGAQRARRAAVPRHLADVRRRPTCRAARPTRCT